ncbi:hypothetical protein [Roseiconus lacunae]|uniref:hypothetical protein n=1 Tax=Roseiconus lacunae TaxID=2605694 RepID=UPI0011F165F8|nr:hypothetical protein [Roseiconus lacunae]
MSGRRRQSLSPNLFPFLAVLVCTLGTLILLLALVAQNTASAAREIAETAANEVDQSDEGLTVGEVKDLVEEEAFRLEKLISMRDAQTGDMERRRDELAHVEDHMRRIQTRLEVIADALKKSRGESVDGVTTEDLQTLQDQLDQKESAVKKLREEVQTEKPRFVIVPHQGQNGTSRRPIYLECHDEGITIWPEEITLTKWQLEQSSPDANPLDDALRAARYHALNQYGDEVPPYPMLLVRPAGVESYYAARAAMTEWDDQFGYELVPQDIELAYPDPDPAMKDKMLYAIRSATERQQNASIIRSVADGRRRLDGQGTLPDRLGHENTMPRSQYGGSAGRGGSATAPQPPTTSKPVPRLSVAEMDRRGRNSGFRDHRALPMRGYNYGNSSSSSSNQSITAEAAKRRLEQMMDHGAQSYANSNANPANPDAFRGQDSVEQAMSEQAFADQSANRSMQFPDGAFPDESARSSSAEVVSPDAASPDAMASSSDRQLELFAPGAMHLPDATEKTQQSGEAGFTDTASRQMKNKEAVATEGGTSFSIGNLGSSGAAPNPQAMKTQAADVSAKSPEASGQRSRQTNLSPPSSRPVQPGGSDWALPDSIALGRGNEIVRHVRLMVYPDRLVLPAARGAPRVESFSIATDGFGPATIKMATAVRDRIDQWGATAPGSRWSPRLKVAVMPGAERQFAYLERLMTGSGLPIEMEVPSQADSGSTGELR